MGLAAAPAVGYPCVDVETVCCCCFKYLMLF
jgi:hypothetical protein